MNKKTIIITVILLGLLLPLKAESMDSPQEGTITFDTFPNNTDVEINALTPHDYIYINSDGEFAAAGFPGNGSETNPYIIENYNFTVSAETAVRISNTNVYFIIRNNFIDGRSTGISCMHTGTGNVVIEDNLIAGHRFRGIFIYNSPETLLDNNTVSDCEIEGISVSYSPSTTLTNNNCYNCGFFFDADTLADYRSYNVLGTNWVNDKPLGYVKDSINTDFRNVLWGQMFFVNFTNVGLYDMNIYNVSYGVVGVYSTQLVIENCTFSNNTEYGVMYKGCVKSDIRDCTFTNNDYGFYSTDSDEIRVLDSNFTQDNQGIYIDLTDNVQVYGCTIINADGEGILIQGGTNILVQANTVLGGTSSSISISDSNLVMITNNYCSLSEQAGLWLYYSSDINVTFNTFLENAYGIYCEDVFLSEIFYNLIENNTLEGVYLDSMTNTTSVFWNTFRNNNGNSNQGLDDGTSNVWYNTDTLSGNWWSDLTGETYSISGSAGVFDLYPLNAPPFPIPEYEYLGLLGVLSLLSLSFVFLLKYRKKHR